MGFQITSSHQPGKTEWVVGDDPYAAFDTYRLEAGLAPPVQIDNIGTQSNPCVRFILDPPSENQRIFYLEQKPEGIK